MDITRAKSIVLSPVMVDVTHNNSPVYMEKINDADQTCMIHYLNNPQKKEIVSLSSLMEH